MAGWPRLRENALFRMQRMTFNHALWAYEKPEGRLPGPHALALLFGSLYSIPTSEVVAATRMFQYTDDRRPRYNVRDLPDLLASQTAMAEERLRAGNWDPLNLTDRCEPLPPGATFIGIGVSSLGNPGQKWEDVRSGFGLRLPSHCDIRLIDGTWLELSRDGEQSQTKVSSNRLLDYMSGFAVGQLIPQDYAPLEGSPHAWLDRLVRVVAHAYDERARGARPRRGR